VTYFELRSDFVVKTDIPVRRCTCPRRDWTICRGRHRRNVGHKIPHRREQRGLHALLLSLRFVRTAKVLVAELVVAQETCTGPSIEGDRSLPPA
jgi:hypothetical protein